LHHPLTHTHKHTHASATRQGLRYAKAPVGDLRFAAPQPAGRYDNTDQSPYDASFDRPVCLQEWRGSTIGVYLCVLCEPCHHTFPM
jgi:carboxylesterase type B